MIVAYSDCSPTTMSPAVCIQVSLRPTHSKPTQSTTQRHVPITYSPPFFKSLQKSTSGIIDGPTTRGKNNKDGRQYFGCSLRLSSRSRYLRTDRKSTRLN